jgi:hypothetical protein
MQMDEFDLFLARADAEAKARQIADVLTADQRATLLLWKAYVKRIRPAPAPVLTAACYGFAYAALYVPAEFEDGQTEALAMDLTGDLLWNALDESARREWLLKAV